MSDRDSKAVLAEELPKLATRIGALAEPAPLLRLLIDAAVNEVRRIETLARATRRGGREQTQTRD